MTKLSERALLASLRISSWSGMQVDNEVTDSVNETYKAGKKAGRYNKRLVHNSFLAGISGAHSAARATHRLLTLPWEDDGCRVLANTGYLTYQRKMHECKQQAEKEVKKFLESPDEYIKEARERLGDMFNEKDYPDPATLATKFAFDVEIKGLPDAGDFRAQLSDAHTKAIIKDIEKRTNDRLEKATNDVFNRIREKVEHLRERLNAYTPNDESGTRTQGIIRDSAITNILELANDVLPVLNIMDDKRIEDLRVKLMSDLVEHSPEILRSDNKIRQLTISKADQILAKVRSYMK